MRKKQGGGGGGGGGGGKQLLNTYIHVCITFGSAVTTQTLRCCMVAE